jgi:hypothetical protein
LPQEIESPVSGTYLAGIIICAVLCVFFQNTVFLSLFFLVPLGYAILRYDNYLLAALITAGLSIGYLFIKGILNQDGYGVGLTELFYFATVIAGFTWIMSGRKLTNIRTAYRFILASCFGFIIYMILFFGGGTEAIVSVLMLYSEGLSTILGIEPEVIFDTITSVMLRGGSLLSLFFVFFINRQMAVTALWIIKRQKTSGGLRTFFVPQNTIWVLSVSAALILFTRQLGLEIPEILVWNVFCVCGIMFLAQGTGILLVFLDSRSAGFRFAIMFLIILMVLSPAMLILVSALVLTGITELWMPFRRKKEPASTPEA